MCLRQYTAWKKWWHSANLHYATLFPSSLAKEYSSLSIRLQTTNPHRPTLEGTLFTICPLTNLLAVTTSPPNPSHHIIPVSSIKDFTLLSGPTPTLPPLTHISTAALQARANEALARRKEVAARINKNVSREAQELFDSLDRHSKVQWLGNDILIYGEVVVKAPAYKVEDCKGVRSDVSSKVVERVKKVVSAIISFGEIALGYKAVSSCST